MFTQNIEISFCYVYIFNIDILISIVSFYFCLLFQQLQQTSLTTMILFILTASLPFSFPQNKFSVIKRPPPPANCIPMGGSCKSPGKVCCDFCAFCQCRLFRTVCYCRMGNPNCWAASCTGAQLQAGRTEVHANSDHLQRTLTAVQLTYWFSTRFITWNSLHESTLLQRTLILFYLPF